MDTSRLNAIITRFKVPALSLHFVLWHDRNGSLDCVFILEFILQIYIFQKLLIMAKKRSYSEDYLKFGFTIIASNDVEKPQYVLCNAVLSAESLKPSKLKCH